MTIGATLIWKEGLSFTGRTARAEVPIGKAGDGEGPSVAPKELVALGLGSCTGMDVVSILERMRSRPKAFQIEVQGETRDTHPKAFHTIRLTFRIDGPATPEQARRSVELSLTRYCGVAATLIGRVEILAEVILNGTALPPLKADFSSPAGAKG